MVASPPGRYLQYRVTLASAAGEGPLLRDVAVHYLPRNQSPTVTLTAPAGGDLLRGTQTLRWTAADPDKDTLTYEVLFSDDDGKTWTALGERIRSRGGSAPPSVAARPDAEKEDLRQRIEENLAANPALARFRQMVEEDPDLTDELRAEALQRADQLIAGVGTPAEEKGLPGVAAAPPAPRAASGSRGAATTRETSLAWDTTLVPDGAYRLKVVATDRVSNPSAPQTAEAQSEPVRVVNRAPWLYLFKKSVRPTPERGITLDGLAESRIPLQGAQYRVDGGDWVAIEAADGIWDGGFEAWSLATAPLRSGSRTVEVKVIDAAGNAAVKSLPIPAPGGSR
jgi:hypothetical protein